MDGNSEAAEADLAVSAEGELPHNQFSLPPNSGRRHYFSCRATGLGVERFPASLFSILEVGRARPFL